MAQCKIRHNHNKKINRNENVGSRTSVVSVGFVRTQKIGT